MQPFQAQNATNIANVSQIHGIDFSAPIIRLGLHQPGPSGNPRGDGLGDHQSHRPGTNIDPNTSRLSQRVLKAPGHEDTTRTIYIAGLLATLPTDDQIEEGLKKIGTLIHWNRAIDSSQRPRSFGFAEFAEPATAALASRALDGLVLSFESKEGTIGTKETESRSTTLKTRLGPIFPDDPTSITSNSHTEQIDIQSIQSSVREGIESSSGNQHGITDDTELVAARTGVIGLSTDTDLDPVNTSEDDLSSIPHEMRALVAAEIAAFRDRSLRRDVGWKRRNEPSTKNPLGTDTTYRNSGAASATQDSPLPILNPDHGTANLHAAQADPDTANPKSVHPYQTSKSVDRIQREREAYPLDDEDHERELENSKVEGELSAFRTQERRWQQREKSRTAALEREKLREQDGKGQEKIRITKERQNLQEWDDDVERMRRTNLYFQDPATWSRTRAANRDNEFKLDQQNTGMNRSLPTGTLSSPRDLQLTQETVMPSQLEKQGSSRIKLSLGAAAQRSQAVNPTKRSIQDIEWLLEDESERDLMHKRTLVPILKPNSPSHDTEVDTTRETTAKTIAAEIPNEKDALWAYHIHWEYITDELIADDLQPFLEKQMIELLGIQEQMIVELVVGHLKQKSSPAMIIRELESVLDDDATVLVYKLWRMVAFFSEARKRGLS